MLTFRAYQPANDQDLLRLHGRAGYFASFLFDHVKFTSFLGAAHLIYMYSQQEKNCPPVSEVLKMICKTVTIFHSKKVDPMKSY